MQSTHFWKAISILGLILLFLAMACGGEKAAPQELKLPELPKQQRSGVQGSTSSTCSKGDLMATTRKSYTSPPAMTIDATKNYTATICLQNGGEMTFELYAREAPNTVNNFVFLARDKFYDGIKFHRVLEDFMAQTGDPTGTGSGGPGYKFSSEFSLKRRHDGPGVLSMANSGGLNTNGSQFFITFASGKSSDLSYLDGYDLNGKLKDCGAGGVSCHTVFGKITDGMDVLTGIQQGDVMKTIVITDSD